MQIPFYTKGFMRRKSIKRGYNSFADSRAGPRELKFKDTTLALTSLDDGGTIVDDTNLLLIEQGNTESKRQGRLVHVTGIHMQGFVQKNYYSNATDSLVRPQSYVRLALIVDHQSNGDSSVAVNDIYETGSFLSFRNLANTSRFTVLKEKMIKITSAADTDGTNGAVYPARQFFKIHLKCKIPVHYNSTTGALAERTVNNLLVVAFSTEDNTTYTDLVQLEYRARIRFSD